MDCRLGKASLHRTTTPRVPRGEKARKRGSSFLGLALKGKATPRLPSATLWLMQQYQWGLFYSQEKRWEN